MRGNPGRIYQTDKGEYGIAYHKEQHESFIKINKVYLHLYEDLDFSRPKIDPTTGKKVVALISVDRLKPIGCVD